MKGRRDVSFWFCPPFYAQATHEARSARVTSELRDAGPQQPRTPGAMRGNQAQKPRKGMVSAVGMPVRYSCTTYVRTASMAIREFHTSPSCSEKKRSDPG